MPYRWILLGLLALAGILLIVIPIVKASARRVVLRRSREPREHVLAAYRVFDGEAADIGMGRREGETLEEHRARLAATVAFSDGHLGRLTDAAERAAYASDGPHARGGGRLGPRRPRRDQGPAQAGRAAASDRRDLPPGL